MKNHSKIPLFPLLCTSYQYDPSFTLDFSKVETDEALAYSFDHLLDNFSLEDMDYAVACAGIKFDVKGQSRTKEG